MNGKSNHTMKETLPLSITLCNQAPERGCKCTAEKNWPVLLTRFGCESTEMIVISRHTRPSTALRTGEALLLFLPPFEKED